jgi:hypothetical protein
VNYRQLNDLIDPDVVADADRPLAHDPENPDDAYLIGEGGKTVAGPPGADKHSPGRGSPRSWVLPVSILLVVLAAGLTIWNASRFIKGPPPPPEPTPVEAKQALYLGVMKIESYRRSHGVTPDTMMESGLAAGSGYTYTRVDSAHYVLVFENGAARQTYDSSIPIKGTFGSPKEMLSMGTPGGIE